MLTRILQRQLRLPSQLRIRASRISSEIEHVTRAAVYDFVVQVAAYDGAEGLDHLEDGGAAAGTEIPGAHAGVGGAEVVEGSEMAVGEIDDVDVVADAGAVAGGVVYTLSAQVIHGNRNQGVAGPVNWGKWKRGRGMKRAYPCQKPVASRAGLLRLGRG